MLKYKVLTEGCDPVVARDGDAGIDLKSAEDFIIKPLSFRVVKLGIAFKIEDGKYGLLTHRSSLAFKQETIASLGIIDSNFTGEVKAKLFNLSPTFTAKVSKGDRICQMVIHKYETEELEEVDTLEDGKGGFGSSGK